MLLLISLSFSIALANNSIPNISTVGRGGIEFETDQAVIKVEVSAEGRDQANLKHHTEQNLKSLKKDLTALELVSQKRITQSEPKYSTYTRKEGVRQEEVNQLKFLLTIELLDFDSTEIASVISELIDIVKANDPSRRRATYNQHYDISYTITQSYYTLHKPIELQEKLLEEAVADSKQKAEVLARTINSSITEIQQIKAEQIDLICYQEEISITNPQPPTKQTYQEKIKVYYKIN
ncbi:SIMPL domain-containing protein [Natroniella acetigena]|uniref:SIMPL domain-containing protein n=1 Tax=Natroniella acetigena TaxID=52004 RepID=UPI00200B6D1B|nr:SIMPL domain-containing protein [Natroniella acetigena]